MKVKLTFAALALMAAGCSNQELTEAVQDGQENNARVITLQASMPETADEAPATRATYEPDGASVSGVVMKWAAGDQLRLCFKKGAAYYHKDAEIDATSISSDGKTAKFTWEMPAEIGDGDTFDFYAVYQRPLKDETYGGVFEAGTANYELVQQESNCITLDKAMSNGDGIINPMLLFSAQNTTKAGLGTLTLNLAHIGWIMAIHLKNSTGAEMDLPEIIRFEDPTASTSSYFWNGSHSGSVVKMDVAAGTLVSTKDHSISLYINMGSFLPLYGQKLAAGAEKVFYRWLVSTDQIVQMRAQIKPKEAGLYSSTNNLPARTVQNGILS